MRGEEGRGEEMRGEEGRGEENRGKERRGMEGRTRCRETVHTAVLLVTSVPTVVVVVTDVSLRHTLLIATGKLARTAVLCYKVTEKQRNHHSPKCTTVGKTL